MRNKALLIFALILIVGISVMSDVFSNAWSLLTERSFIIPTESSIIMFKVTSMNEGSGDWWVYGEDANFYYHFIGSDQVSYTKIARNIKHRHAKPLIP